MPTIRSSTDLRNNYNDISNFCNQYQEPMFITKNGQGDLAVMSIDYYESLIAKLELYQLIDAGATAINKGQKKPFSDVVSSIRQEIQNGNL
ncbi:MAG: type II toxin-antitoxin system Phd/YefM family antitoxin [Turicibacter sp.]|nr:type II toxin-antitoxin system Phd/YefM family antitoxin [Turicibacter sp.]